MSLRASGTGIFNFCVCFRECLPTLFPCLCMVMTDTSIETRTLGDCDQISAFIVNTLQILYNNVCWTMLTPRREKYLRHWDAGWKICWSYVSGRPFLRGNGENISGETSWQMDVLPVPKLTLDLCIHSNPKKHKTKTFKMSGEKTKT